MSTSPSHSNNFDQTTELYFSEVLAGKPETVRMGLIEAMESLGYDIIEEQPNIIGRRAARGWGKSYMSADVLDYAATLTIRFRNIGETSSRVTFDYLIKHGWLNEGEKKIVVQEARTIAALSRTPAISKMCPVCGIDSTDDSRFCRSCGAPLTSESSELEVLRLMAETRAAKTSVVTTSLTTVAGTAGLLAALGLSITGLLTIDAVFGFAIVSTLLLICGILSSFFGWNRLKSALKVPASTQIPERRPTSELYESPQRATITEGKQYKSVTEGTTNLLNSEWMDPDGREKVLISEKRETNELD